MVGGPVGAARTKMVQWKLWSRQGHVRGQDFCEAQVGAKAKGAPTLVCSLAAPRQGLAV